MTKDKEQLSRSRIGSMVILPMLIVSSSVFSQQSADNATTAQLSNEMNTILIKSRGRASSADATRLGGYAGVIGEETAPSAKHPLCEPHMGQTPPGDTRTLFAYQLVPASYSAHGALHFSTDGCEVYWSLYKDPSTFVIMESHFDSDAWSTPAPVPFTSQSGDCCPFLTPDDSRLIFTSLRPKPPTVESLISFFSVDRIVGGWSEPTLLGEPFLSATVAWQGSITDFGDIYFPQKQVAGVSSSQTEEWDIVRSRLVDGVYHPVEHLGDSVNSASWEFAPFVAPDGSYIIFRSDRPGGYGRGDLWVCFAKPDGSWTEAQNLGAQINSSGDEGYPSVSNDGEYLFWVSPLPPGYAYYWISMSVVENLRPDTATNVDDDQRGEELPYTFELTQNYPNPFNPVTKVEYSLPQRSHVTIDVYNVLGEKVRTLVDLEASAGSYTITWDGKSESGQLVSTGVYLYRFRAGEHVETKKMLLLK